jgi:hypothetical protein
MIFQMVNIHELISGLESGLIAPRDFESKASIITLFPNAYWPKAAADMNVFFPRLTYSTIQNNRHILFLPPHLRQRHLRFLPQIIAHTGSNTRIHLG